MHAFELCYWTLRAVMQQLQLQLKLILEKNSQINRRELASSHLVWFEYITKALSDCIFTIAYSIVSYNMYLRYFFRGVLLYCLSYPETRYVAQVEPCLIKIYPHLPTSSWITGVGIGSIFLQCQPEEPKRYPKMLWTIAAVSCLSEIESKTHLLDRCIWINLELTWLPYSWGLIS